MSRHLILKTLKELLKHWGLHLFRCLLCFKWFFGLQGIFESFRGIVVNWGLFPFLCKCKSLFIGIFAKSFIKIHAAISLDLILFQTNIYCLFSNHKSIPSLNIDETIIYSNHNLTIKPTRRWYIQLFINCSEKFRCIFK